MYSTPTSEWDVLQTYEPGQIIEIKAAITQYHWVSEHAGGLAMTRFGCAVGRCCLNQLFHKLILPFSRDSRVRHKRLRHGYFALVSPPAHAQLLNKIYFALRLTELTR